MPDVDPRRVARAGVLSSEYRGASALRQGGPVTPAATRFAVPALLFATALILADQMEYLLAGVPRTSRLHAAGGALRAG